jgi:hypothetical protein
MKKTKYFISAQRSNGELSTVITEAENKRDEFLSESRETIGSIDREEIQIIGTNTHNNSIQAIITLTYFEKA